MKKTQFLWFIAGLILVAAVILRLTSREDEWICQNGAWVKHGQPSSSQPTTTCPRSFSEPAASSFTALQGEVIINSPQPNEVVKSPLTVSGQARGNWFFEANIPVKLTDDNNNIIASAGGHSQGEWMTENLVPFSANLTFETEASNGFLVISKDNPSGLPQNDASVSIPVRFK